MTEERIIADFRAKVGASVVAVAEGVGRYVVETPFTFPDGDGIVVVLRGSGQSWHLTDEGHTLMHMSYWMDEGDLHKGNRGRIFEAVTDLASVEHRDGELRMDVPGQRFGDALFTFIQSLVQVADLTYLARDRVKSTFIEDFEALVSEAVPTERLSFGWFDPSNDPNGEYQVDCRVNGLEQPVFLFAVPTDSRAKDATIALLKFETWEVPHRGVAVYEDQAALSRRAVARLTDACDRQFSDLGSNNRERLADYLVRALAAGPSGS